MEASGTAVGGEGTEGTQEGVEAQEGAEGAQENGDIQSVLDRMNEVGGQVEQMQPILQQLAQAQQGEGEEDQGSFEDRLAEFADDQGEVTPENLEKFLGSEIQRGIQEGIQQHVAPLQQQLGEVSQFLRAEQLDGLMEQYPALQDEATQDKFVNEVKGYAEHFNRPDLAGDADFAELVYLAGWAGERAAQEGPGAEQGVQIEGSSTAGGQADVDPGEAIMRAGGSDSIWGR